MSIKGYRISITDDDEELCIVPEYAIPFEHFISLFKFYEKLGYKYWIPSDHRCGYNIRKSPPEEKTE